MSLMSKIRDWFKGGNTNRSTSTRGTTRTTTTSTNRSGVRQIASQVDNSAEEERKRRIKEAFAESNKKAEEARAKARTDAEKSKSTFANTQVAKKKTNVAKQELDAMAKAKGYSGYSKVDSLDRKYMQEDEKISAKNNPLAYTFAKSAANGAMLNLPKVVEKYGTSDAEKKHQAQVNKIVHQNATDKQIKRAELGGEIVGSLAIFGAGSGASRAIASMPKVAPKVAQMSNKLATTEAMKKLGARMIEKGAFKGTVEQAARHYSEKLATELTADAILDHSMSLADSTNRAITTEGDINDKIKSFLVNQGLNVGISGAIDIAPAVLKSMKGSGALKVIMEEQAKKAKNAKAVAEEMAKMNSINIEAPKIESDLQARLNANKGHTEPKNNLPSDNYGYHAGDLGKAEYYESTIGGDRDTGFYGTGTYFLGKPNELSLGNYANRPLHKISFDDYNLYKPKDYEEGNALHTTLGKINKGAEQYIDYSDVDFNSIKNGIDSGDMQPLKEFVGNRMREDDVNSYRKEVQSIIERVKNRDYEKEYAEHSRDFKRIGLEPDNKEEFIANLKREDEDFIKNFNQEEHLISVISNDIDNIIEKHKYAISLPKDVVDEISALMPNKSVEEIQEAFDRTIATVKEYRKSNNYKVDSPSTVFMKNLGYEGIDVRGIDGLDDTRVGSVIYDLKQQDRNVLAEPPVKLVSENEQIPFDEPLSAEKQAILERLSPKEEIDAANVMAENPKVESPKTILEHTDRLKNSNFGDEIRSEKITSFNEYASAHGLDLENVKSAQELKELGVKGNQTTIEEIERVKAFTDKFKAQIIADKNGKRISDSSVSSIQISKDESYRAEGLATLEAQGIRESDLRSNALDKVSKQHLFSNEYEKLSYKEMAEAAARDVDERPMAVMEHLYNKMFKGTRLMPSDLALASNLIRYGDEFGIQVASDIGHKFKIEYANEVGRLSGMYQFMAREWNYLSASAKSEVLARQMSKLCDELGVSFDEMVKRLDETQSNVIIEELKRRPADGNYQYTFKEINGEVKIFKAVEKDGEVVQELVENPSFVDVMLDGIIHGSDEELTNSAKRDLFDAIRGTTEPSILSTMMAWRYLAMLGNPKTHFRNIVGNLVFGTTRLISDVLESTIQSGMKSLGVIDYKTRTFLDPKEFAEVMSGNDATYGGIIKDAFAQDKGHLMSLSEGRLTKMIKENNSKSVGVVHGGINKANKKVGDWLEAEDEWFVKRNYFKSFMQFLKANGYGTDAANIMANGGHFADEQSLLEAARSFAQEDAVEATFRNHTEFSKVLSKLVNAGTKKDASLLKKGGSLSVNAVTPFTTTPVNILTQGFKFSPLGIINGTARMYKALKSGDAELFLKTSTDFAQGLTGMGVFALGFYWGQNVFCDGKLSLSTSAGDDDKAKAYKRAGVQDYSLVYTDENGNGWSYSLDWCSPMAQTLFMGAEMGKNMQGGNEIGDSFFDKEARAMSTLSKLLDPVLEMSMLQGINGFIEGAADNDDMNGMSAGITSLARTYIGSYIPSILGSISRTFSPYDYETVGTSATDSGNSIEYWVNSQVAKIPVLSSKYLAPKINEKGEVVGEKNGAKDYAKAAFQNFVNVGNFKRINMSESDQEEFKLYDELVKEGDEYAGDVFAKVDYGTEKHIGQKSKKYGIAPDELKIDKFERAEWNKDRATNGMQGLEEVLKSKAWNSYYGKDDDKRNARASEVRSMTNIKSSDDALNWLISQPEYKNADNSEKKEMIKQVLNDARDYSANKTLYMNRGNSEADYRFKVDLPAKAQAQENAFKKAGISKEDVLQFYDKAKKVSYSDDGTPHTSYSKKNMYAALNGMSLSEEQKALLYNTFKTSNAKEYGASGNGGRRRGSSGGSKKTAKQSSASKSAFKVSVKDSDYKSIVNAGSTTEQRKIAKSLGLSDEEIKAIIKQANRENLKLKG